jgi:hypothetical protein
MKWRGWLPFLLPLEKITATVAVNAKGATEEEEKCADKKDIAVVDVYAPFRLFFVQSIQALKGETFLTKFVIVLLFFNVSAKFFTQRVIDYRIIRRCHDRLITVCKNFDTSTLTHFRPSRAGHTPMNQRAEGAQKKQNKK